MKALRIIIVAFILITVGIFIYLTAGTDAETLLFDRILLLDQRTILLVLLILSFTLLSTLTGLPILYLSIALGFLLNLATALLLCWAINIISVIATFYLVRFAFTSYFRERYGEKKLIQRINFSFPLSNISIRS